MEEIGYIIEQQVRKQGRSITWLANQLSCHWTNVYAIFRRNNIDVILLQKLSEVLDFNFFEILYKEEESRRERNRFL